jgi:Rrf2 family transcriptional regulator, iron-sulfur cluster assembly transcription factor
LQKLVDDQLRKAPMPVHDDAPSIRRAISREPVLKPIRMTGPNSVFAMGGVFSKV